MSIRFDKNYYLAQIKKEANFSSESSIYKYAAQNVQFKYGNVTYEKFAENYPSEGWLGRKIIAIPAALWSAVVKTIFHLAKAIIIGIPAAPFSSKYLKEQLFSVGRDLQEALGWLTTFFNDVRGQYHVQESQFHKTCYDFFTSTYSLSSVEVRPPGPTLPPSTGTGLTLPTGSGKPLPPSAGTPTPQPLGAGVPKPISSGRAPSCYAYFWSIEKCVFNPLSTNDIATSLYDFKNKTALEQERIIKKFKLEQTLSDLKNSNLNFQEFLDRADEALLKELTIEDLILPLNDSKLKYALLDNDKFNNLTLKDLDCFIYKNQLAFIKKRVALSLQNEGATLQPLTQPNFQNDASEIRIRDLAQINPEEITKQKDNIPDIAFAFFVKSQIQTLKLSELHEGQNTALFAALANTEASETLSLFNDQDVVDALHKNVLTGDVLKFVNTEQIKQLTLFRLTSEQVRNIFSPSKGTHLNRSDFRFFKIEDVQEALKKGIISYPCQYLLSDEHLRALQLAKLTKDTIREMFNGGCTSTERQEDKKRFALLSKEQVRDALNEKLIIHEYILSLISDEQMQAVELSKLTKDVIKKMFSGVGYAEKEEDKRRFALLPPEQVREALNAKLITHEYILSLISDKQMKAVELSKLTQDVIKKMFSGVGYAEKEEDKRRFALLPPEQVREALNANLITHEYILSLISDTQMRAVELSKLTKDVIKEMFSGIGYAEKEEDKRRFALLPKEQVREALNKKLITQNHILSHCSKSKR